MSNIVRVRNHPNCLRRHKLTESKSKANPASAAVKCPPVLTLNGEYCSSKRSRCLREGVTADRTLTTPMMAVSNATMRTKFSSERANRDFIANSVSLYHSENVRYLKQSLN